MAVKTPVGLTQRESIPTIVMQGGTFGPMQCSNSIDSIGKKCISRQEHLYSYKNLVKVTPLAMVDDLLAVAPCGIDSLAVNVFINTQIEMKKLKFHTPDANGKSKCHVMHIGKKNMSCPDLKVHGTPMGFVTEDTYLGDIVSQDGSNQKNVRSRVGKGIGIISQILLMLETVSFGHYYLQIALTLRETMFLSGILTNAEIWYNLKQSKIEEFEELDRSLLRKIFGTKISCPKEALHLESGTISVGTYIKARRINYLQYLLKENNDNMLSKFFHAQYNFEVKHDWTATVRQDLIDFGIQVNLENIKSKSEFVFKKMVKLKAQEYELCKLNSMKGSKMENTFHGKLEIQKYLMQKNISAEDAKLVFAFRTRMANFSENFLALIVPKCVHYVTHIWITNLWRSTAQLSNLTWIRKESMNISSEVKFRWKLSET